MGQNQNQARLVYGISRHYRYELWFLKMSEDSPRRDIQNRDNHLYLLSLNRPHKICWDERVTMHLTRYGFPSHLDISIEIHYFNSTTARCSGPLKCCGMGILFMGSATVKLSNRLKYRSSPEDCIPIKVLVCLRDWSVFTKMISPCLIICLIKAAFH